MIYSPSGAAVLLTVARPDTFNLKPNQEEYKKPPGIVSPTNNPRFSN